MILGDLIPKAAVWLERHGAHLLDDRDAGLLEAVERSGSIKEAAKAARLSYRTAWARIQEMERVLGKPVVRSRAGGLGGGATSLTDESRELLRLHREVRRRVDAALRAESASPPTPPSGPRSGPPATSRVP